MRVVRPEIPQYKSLFRSVDLTKTIHGEIPIIVSILVKIRIGHGNRIYYSKCSLQHGYQFKNTVVLIPLYWAGARAMLSHKPDSLRGKGLVNCGE